MIFFNNLALLIFHGHTHVKKGYTGTTPSSHPIHIQSEEEMQRKKTKYNSLLDIINSRDIFPVYIT